MARLAAARYGLRAFVLAAVVLAEKVEQILADISADSPAGLREFKAAVGGDITRVSWDWYWRLFTVWEDSLAPEAISDHLADVPAAAHRAADLPERSWELEDDPFGPDVPAAGDATILAAGSDKTAEINPETGQTMVWWTSVPSGRFQVVRRRERGWVNWGTNDENECPELPRGATIRTAYGPYAAAWREVAERLETPPSAELRTAM